jgi:hypothetical protein
MCSSTLPSTLPLGGGWVATLNPSCFTLGIETVCIVQEAGWAMDWCRKYRPTRIHSLNRPAHSESLYWRRYPCPQTVNSTIINISHIIQQLGAPQLPNKVWPIHFWLYTVESIKYIYTHTYTNTWMLKNCGYTLAVTSHRSWCSISYPKHCKCLTSKNLCCLRKWKGDGGQAVQKLCAAHTI